MRKLFALSLNFYFPLLDWDAPKECDSHSPPWYSFCEKNKLRGILMRHQLERQKQWKDMKVPGHIFALVVLGYLNLSPSFLFEMSVSTFFYLPPSGVIKLSILQGSINSKCIVDFGDFPYLTMHSSGWCHISWLSVRISSIPIGSMYGFIYHEQSTTCR